jgi:hypothetical protein
MRQTEVGDATHATTESDDNANKASLPLPCTGCKNTGQGVTESSSVTDRGQTSPQSRLAALLDQSGSSFCLKSGGQKVFRRFYAHFSGNRQSDT